MSLALSSLRFRPSIVYRRCLATASTSTAPAKTKFSQSLDNGPSFEDFLSEEPAERIVLGNTKGYDPCIIGPYELLSRKFL